MRPIESTRNEGVPFSRLLVIPVAAIAALAVHLVVSKSEPATQTRSYSTFVGILFFVGIAADLLQLVLPRVRSWMRETFPIFGAAIFLMAIWELITVGFHWLPMPYFPGPAGILQSIISDRMLLLDSAWHSLVLLLSGYC